MGATDRVFDLIEQEPSIQDGDHSPDRCEGAVRLESVDFAYPTRPDNPVLTNLSA